MNAVSCELLTALTPIQFRAEPGTILTRRFEQRPHFADSGLQLDLGDRVKRCLSEDPASAEDSSKLSDDVIEDEFTSTPDSRILYLSIMRLGAAKTARESVKSPEGEILYARGFGRVSLEI